MILIVLEGIILFYNYRNKIYIIGIFILLFGAFWLGRSSVNENMIVKNQLKVNKETEIPIETTIVENTQTPIENTPIISEEEEGHIEYKKDIEIKGKDYIYKYNLSYATIINKNLSIFIEELKKDKNIVSVSIQATNDTNSPLKVVSNGQGNYNIELNKATEKVNIKVIPITKNLKSSISKKKIKIEELPFGASSLNIKMIITETIRELEENINEG
jgi:hypothetical protein